MDLNGINLRWATAQPLCRIDGPTPLFVFFATDGVAPQLALAKSATLSITDASGAAVAEDGMLNAKSETDAIYTLHDGEHSAKIMVLTRKQALGAYVAELAGQKRLILSPDGVPLVDDAGLRVQSMQPHAAVSICPPMTQSSAAFSKHELSANPKSVEVKLEQSQPTGKAREITPGSRKKPSPPEDGDFKAAGVWQATVPADALTGVHDLLLNIDYTGDVARAYIGDRFVDDQFFYGQPWQIGLATLGKDAIEKGITLKILPLQKSLPAYIDEEHRPDFANESQLLKLNSVTAQPVYEMQLK